MREKDICQCDSKLFFTFWICTVLETLVVGLLPFGPRKDKFRQTFATAPAAGSTMKNLVILYFQSDPGDEKRERRKPTGPEVNG